MHENNIVKRAAGVLTIWRSGFVNRYHSHYDSRLRNSQDLTDAHSARMVKLAMSIFPEDCDLKFISYLIMHDAPEFAAGDSPHHAKRSSVALKNALDDLEYKEMVQFEDLCGTTFDPIFLTERQGKIATLLDQLDSLLLQASLTPNRMGTELDLIGGILRQASVLGVRQTVFTVISHAFNFYGVDFVIGSPATETDHNNQKEAYRA